MSNTLGQHIRTIRKSNKLRLRELSEKSGLSIPYLSDIERDAVNPSIKSVESIAVALKVSLPELFDYNNQLTNRLLTENRKLRERLKNVQLLVANF